MWRYEFGLNTFEHFEHKKLEINIDICWTEKQIKDTQVLNSSLCMNELSMSPEQLPEWLKYGCQYQELASLWNQ